MDVIIQCELGREPGGQTSLPDNNLVLVSVNDINSFMTILIIIIFSFESNQINLDLLSNVAKFLQISEICCIASALNKFKMGHCSKKCITSSISNLHSLQKQDSFIYMSQNENFQLHALYFNQLSS